MARFKCPICGAPTDKQGKTCSKCYLDEFLHYAMTEEDRQRIITEVETLMEELKEAEFRDDMNNLLGLFTIKGN